MPSYAEELRKLHQESGLVELYDLDATALGGSTYHLTPYFLETSIFFNGVEYLPFPLASYGWELSASGTMPRPTLQVSNVTQVFLSAVVNLGDLTGMSVTRFFTYEKFLDDAPEADGGMHSRPEEYIVEAKVEHTETSITWQLCSPLDRTNLILPKRQYLKDDISGNVYAPGLSRFRGV